MESGERQEDDCANTCRRKANHHQPGPVERFWVWLWLILIVRTIVSSIRVGKVVVLALPLRTEHDNKSLVAKELEKLISPGV